MNKTDPDGLDIDNTEGSDQVTYIPETGRGTKEVPPRENFTGKHDGLIDPENGDPIKTAGKHGIEDNVKINKDGSVSGIDEWMGSERFDTEQKIDNFLNERHKKGDHQWDEIAKKAKERLKKKKKPCPK